MKRKLLLLSFLFLTTLFGNNAIAQCDCGDGSDGAFSATTNVVLPSGTYNYSSFYIESGMTVSVTGNQPLIINCTGSILIDGILDVSGGTAESGVPFSNGGAGGIGVAGGHDGGNGTFSPGPAVPGMQGLGPGGGGGGNLLGGGGAGGYGTVGGDGSPFGSGPIGAGGSVYGNIYLADYDGGSGGGGGSGGSDCGGGGGGAGGGILIMRTCDTLTITGGGVISANGGHGASDGGAGCGGGGGGSGGTVWLIADRLEHDGNIQAYGGYFGSSAGGADGGFGPIGRVRLDYNTLSGSGNTSPAAAFTTTLFNGIMTNIDPLCAGDATGLAYILPLGGGGFYTYLWTGGGTDDSLTNIGAGTYVVTTTDTNGCSVNDTVVVSEPPALASTGTSTNETTVTANDGTATVTVTGGTAPYSYLWTPGGGTTSSITGLDTGMYIVTITDDNGCPMLDTVHVGQDPVSVHTTIADHGVSIYPNPASDVVTIAFKNKVNGEVMIQLTDNLGRVIVSEKHTNASVFQLYTNSLATGSYILRISAEGSTRNVPLSVVR